MIELVTSPWIEIERNPVAAIVPWNIPLSVKDCNWPVMPMLQPDIGPCPGATVLPIEIFETLPVRAQEALDTPPPMVAECKAMAVGAVLPARLASKSCLQVNVPIEGATSSSPVVPSDQLV